MTQMIVNLLPFAGHAEVCNWVRANYGLEPNDIPSDSQLLLDFAARTVTCEVVATDERGNVLLEGNAVRRKTVVQQMESPPARWPWRWEHFALGKGPART